MDGIELDYNVSDIGINSVTVYSLEKTLRMGKDSFTSLSNVISQTDLSGASGKIVGLFNEVKSSVSSLTASYEGMTNTVSNVKGKIVELFPEDSELFIYLDSQDEVEFFDVLLGEAERLCDLDTLLNYFDNDKNKNYIGGLNALPSGTNVADYYNNTVLFDGTVVDGKTYANLLQTAILKKYSGREAAVKSMLLPIGLAANKGYYITYEHHGTMAYDRYDKSTRMRATLDTILGGCDCNAAVSYGIAQGAKGDFAWWGVGGFANQHYKNNKANDYSAVQIGDVLHKEGHVVMVVDNNPNTGELTIAESTGSGYQTGKWTYDQINGLGYMSYDMTRVYG